MIAIRLFSRIALLLALLVMPMTAPALAQVDDATLTPLVDALAPGNFRDREAAARALAATEDPRAVPVLETLLAGELYAVKETGKVVFYAGGKATDPVSGAEVGEFGSRDVEKVKVNNGLRRNLRTIIGQMTLMSDDPGIRLGAAQQVLRSAEPDNLELLDTALAAETDAGVRSVMETARAAIILKTEAPIDERLAAIATVEANGGRDAIGILTAALATAPEELKPELQSAVDTINRNQAVWGVAQNVWYGLSLGSVLLLAAIGLAITFGVMGSSTWPMARW